MRFAQDGRTLSKGYGFVDFSTREEAEAAVKALNGKNVLGKKLKVGFAKPSGQRVKSNLFVSQIPDRWNESDLDTVFGQFGNIIERRILRDLENKSRCSAFVRFDNNEQAKNAIQNLNNSRPQEGDQPITVRVATDNDSGNSRPKVTKKDAKPTKETKPQKIRPKQTRSPVEVAPQQPRAARPRSQRAQGMRPATVPMPPKAPSRSQTPKVSPTPQMAIPQEPITFSRPATPRSHPERNRRMMYPNQSRHCQPQAHYQRQELRAEPVPHFGHDRSRSPAPSFEEQARRDDYYYGRGPYYAGPMYDNREPDYYEWGNTMYNIETDPWTRNYPRSDYQHQDLDDRYEPTESYFSRTPPPQHVKEVPKQSTPSHEVHFANFPPFLDESSIMNMCSSYGEVEFVRIASDNNGNHIGMATVGFRDLNAMQRAVDAFHGCVVGGLKVHCSVANSV
jgi:RNA recognition motif-containing protein